MKTFTTLQLILLLYLLNPSIVFGQSEMVKKSPKQFNSWFELNAGYSNHGAAGNLNYTIGYNTFIFSTEYIKSHRCYDSHENDQNYMIEGDRHESMEGVSVMTGMFLPGRLRPTFQIGISLLQFKYVTTSEIGNNVTAERIWETVLDKDYTTETIHQKLYSTIGIPIGFKLHFQSTYLAGLESGIEMNFNTHSPFVMAEIGFRFGRLPK